MTTHQPVDRVRHIITAAKGLGAASAHLSIEDAIALLGEIDRLAAERDVWKERTEEERKAAIFAEGERRTLRAKLDEVAVALKEIAQPHRVGAPSYSERIEIARAALASTAREG